MQGRNERSKLDLKRGPPQSLRKGESVASRLRRSQALELKKKNTGENAFLKKKQMSELRNPRKRKESKQTWRSKKLGSLN